MLPWCKFLLERGYFFVAITLYIVETKLLPKDLKPLRVAVFTLFVFLAGCASTRPTSTQSRASDDDPSTRLGRRALGGLEGRIPLFPNLSSLPGD
jgi:hypothetical protein